MHQIFNHKTLLILIVVVVVVALFGFPIGSNGLYFVQFFFWSSYYLLSMEFWWFVCDKVKKTFYHVLFFSFFFSFALSIHFYQYAITSSMRQPITLFRQFFFFCVPNKHSIVALLRLEQFCNTVVKKSKHSVESPQKKYKNNQHIDSIWHSTQNIFQNEHTVSYWICCLMFSWYLILARIFAFFSFVL